MTLQLSSMRWLITLVGVQFLCAIVWVLGPLLASLERAGRARLVLMLLLLIVWAAANLAARLRGGRRREVR